MYLHLSLHKEDLKMQQQTPSNQNKKRDMSSILETADSLDEITNLNFEDDPDETDERLSKDDVFNVLYNSLRRDVITYLQEHDGEAIVSDIAEHIAAKENDTTVRQLSSYERKRVYIGLYQNHLPMMHDVGVLEYDKDRGTVRLRECATQLEPYLEDADRSDRSAITISGAVALAGVLLFGVLDIGVVGLVPEPILLTLGAIGLVGLTAFKVSTDPYPELPPRLTDRIR